MNSPEPQTKNYLTLISDIEKGQIKIPQCQRDFVWSIKKSANLLDSIVKGYPIGTFIFWRTQERLRSIRNLGGNDLPEPPQGEVIDYVLDGQQRLTSLYACLKGLSVNRADKKHPDNFAEIYIDLTAKDDEQIVVTKIVGDEQDYISILDLMSGGLTHLAGYPSRHHKKIESYKSTIENYLYSVIQINEVSIDIATEVFTRINVGGQTLTVFQIMVAKTFDAEKDFDLLEKYKGLVERLEHSGYDTIPDRTVLQAISMLIAGECSRQTILGLDKQKFIETWDNAVDAIERAVDYFKNYYRIPVSKLLPYNALVVPFACFFSKHPDKPTGDMQKRLADLFWRCSLSGRYSSTVETYLAQDVKKVDAILSGRLPAYDWSIDTSEKYIIENGWFSAGRSYIKGILCIYAYQQPKSFIDESIVNISNDWLKQANSKNYHHFFPKAFLEKQQNVAPANHVLNITIVDDFLNKRKIGKKSPSKYMADFAKQNPSLPNTMKSHLIGDLEAFGIWDDNYDVFFDNRAKLVSSEIKKRIIKQDIDNSGQLPLLDDEAD